MLKTETLRGKISPRLTEYGRTRSAKKSWLTNKLALSETTAPFVELEMDKAERIAKQVPYDLIIALLIFKAKQNKNFIQWFFSLAT